MNRQRLILFILVIIFAIALMWSYSAMPRPKTVSTLTYKPGQPAQATVATTTATAAAKSSHNTDDGTQLKIGLLEAESTGFKGYRRNLFKPVFVDELKTVKQVSAIKWPQMLASPPVQPLITQPEAAPLARFTFLGFLKKGSVKTIFLARDSDILLVKKGDIIIDRYEATDVSDQALTLTVTDTGDKIVIPLIENQPLDPAR